jgi:nitrogen-specific signal transduction histidine kinase
MLTAVQVGENDMRDILTDNIDLDITHDSPKPAADLISNGVDENGDCVTITAPLDGDVDPVDLATTIEEVQGVPAVIVAHPEKVDVVEITTSGVEYIPVTESEFDDRLLTTRLQLYTRQQQAVDQHSEWRTGVDVLSHLFSAVRSADLKFEQKLTFTVALLMGQLGYEHGYSAKITSGEAELGVVQGPNIGIDQEITGDVAHYPSEYAVDDNGIVTINDVSQSKRDRMNEKETFGLKSYLISPIRCEESFYGTVCLASESPTPKSVSQEQVPVVETVSEWLGIALQRQQAEQKAQRQIERLENFMRIVSHDMKNPLSVAKGRYEILENELPEDNPHVRKGLTAINRLENIIDSSVEYAKGGGELANTEEIKIDNLVEKCLETMNIGEEEINVTVVDKFSVDGDRNKLAHIFENIFRNSVKHGREPCDGPINIRIGLDNVMFTSTRSGNPTGEFGFYIEDNGCGIPPHKTDEIFDVGESFDSDGSGFGLSIVEEAATAHGWEVTVAESYEGGARFEFSGVTG